MFSSSSYVVGGRLLNIFTEFYAVTPEILSLEGMDFLSVESPKWIGAWWLGFLLILVLSYICAALLAFFPRMLPTAPALNATKSERSPQTSLEDSEACAEQQQVSVVKAEESTLEKNDDYYGLLMELPRAMWDLITNPTYMFISFGAIMDGFLLTG